MLHFISDSVFDGRMITLTHLCSGGGQRRGHQHDGAVCWVSHLDTTGRPLLQHGLPRGQRARVCRLPAGVSHHHPAGEEGALGGERDLVRAVIETGAYKNAFLSLARFSLS